MLQLSGLSEKIISYKKSLKKDECLIENSLTFYIS